MDQCERLGDKVVVRRGRTVFVEFFEWLPVVVGGTLFAISGLGPWFLVGLASLASGIVIGAAAGRESRSALWKSLCSGLARAIGGKRVVGGYIELGKSGVRAALRLENGVDLHFWGGLPGMWAVAARSPVYVRGGGRTPRVWSIPCKPHSRPGRLSYGVMHPLFGWNVRIYGRGGVSSVFCPLGVLDENLIARVVSGALEASY